MSLLALYTLFALATAFMAIKEILVPVFSLQSKTNRIEYKGIIVVTFFLVSFLMAPFMLLPCFSFEMNYTFREAFAKSLFSKD